MMPFRAINLPVCGIYLKFTFREKKPSGGEILYLEYTEKPSAYISVPYIDPDGRIPENVAQINEIAEKMSSIEGATPILDTCWLLQGDSVRKAIDWLAEKSVLSSVTACSSSPEGRHLILDLALDNIESIQLRADMKTHIPGKEGKIVVEYNCRTGECVFFGIEELTGGQRIITSMPDRTALTVRQKPGESTADLWERIKKVVEDEALQVSFTAYLSG